MKGKIIIIIILGKSKEKIIWWSYVFSPTKQSNKIRFFFLDNNQGGKSTK